MVFKDLLVLLIETDFKIDFFKHKKVRYSTGYKSIKKIEENANSFINWIMEKLQIYHGAPVSGWEYNACCLYLNNNNLKTLQTYLAPMDYLNYSPREDNNLKNNELGIDLNDIITKTSGAHDG